MIELYETPSAELVWTPTNDAWPFPRWWNLWRHDASSGFPSSPAFRSGVFDRGEAFEVVVELPGIPKEKIDVSVQGTRLKIHAEEGSPPSETAPASEYRYRVFERAFELPEAVPASAIQARAENGVLTVRVPKPKPAPEEKVPLA